MIEFLLSGPKGDNPLGLLTALGVVLTLNDAGHVARLGWDGVTPGLVASFDGIKDPETSGQQRSLLIDVLYQQLQRKPGSGAARTEDAKKEMEAAKTAVKKKRGEIKKRRLDRNAAKEARDSELKPLQEDLQKREATFKRALTDSAADPSVALGKNLTELNVKLIDHTRAAYQRAKVMDRRWADLVAAYGVADPANLEKRMAGSPWALVSGSGHQDFLSSVQELMVRCRKQHFEQALFGAWNPQDEKYSLRLDVVDDRRYALMDRNPTAGDNKPRTLWGANRLAFEALRFFPAMPVRGGMAVRTWRPEKSSDWQENCRVRWPLWRQPIGVATIHSLLGLRDLWLEEPADRERLRALGVHAVMESRRIAVGQGANRKYNLTPATPVWIASSQEKGAAA